MSADRAMGSPAPSWHRHAMQDLPPARTGLHCNETEGEAAMATHPNPITVDDVLDLPLPEGVIGYEFVNGEPVPVMSGSLIHGRLIIEVGYRLRRHVEEAGLDGFVVSDAGFVMNLRYDRERMRGPDVSYVAREKTIGIDWERLFRGVPDLAVEIDLTSGRKPGGQQRIVDYLTAGVKLVWVIDPHSRTAVIYHQDGSARLVHTDGVLDGEDVVRGFRLPIAELFR
jgi:Uma2 family endonuclease